MRTIFRSMWQIGQSTKVDDGLAFNRMAVCWCEHLKGNRCLCTMAINVHTDLRTGKVHIMRVNKRVRYWKLMGLLAGICLPNAMRYCQAGFFFRPEVQARTPPFWKLYRFRFTLFRFTCATSFGSAYRSLLCIGETNWFVFCFVHRREHVPISVLRIDCT